MNVAGSPSIALPPPVREFVAAPHFGSIASVDSDGSPRQAIIWYLLDGNELVVNSRVGRRWPTNLLRDARVYLAVFDEADPLRWVGLLGGAEPVVDQPQAQADIAAMARRYHHEDLATAERKIRDFEQQQRISFRIRVRAVHQHLD